MKLQSIVALLALTTFTACGGGGGGSTPPVGTQNKAPVLSKDSGEVINGEAVTVDVLANDTDPDGDSLTITSVESSEFGAVEVIDNKIRFTPSNQSLSGADSLSYTVSDGNNHSVSSTLELEFIQSIEVQGKVLAMGGDAIELSYRLDGEIKRQTVDAQGNFELTIQSNNTEQAIGFDVSNGLHTLKGYSTSFIELIQLAGNDRTVTASDTPLVVVTPVSTVYQVLFQAKLDVQQGDQPTTEVRESFELGLDADVLLESAAMVKMFTADNIALPAGINSLEEFINSKSAVWDFSVGLIADDEKLQVTGSDGSLVKGVAARSAKLEVEINNIKTLIQRYVKPGIEASTAKKVVGNQAVKSDTNKNIFADSLTYYQLRPGYDNRIANYDFSGALLKLENDGTGYYQNEMGAANFTWQESEGIIHIEFPTPITEVTYTSPANLQSREIVPASIIEAMNNGDQYINAYISLSLTAIDIQIIADNDFVDIVSMTPHYKMSAQPIWGDEELNFSAIPRYQELRATDTHSTLPFTENEIVGQWGMGVIIPASRNNFDGEVSVETNIYSDLLTLNVDGTGSALIAEQSLTWSLKENGELEINQQNGGSLTVIRLAQDGKAFGALFLAELGGKSVSSYRMIAKKEITSFDLTQSPDVYWQASWGLSNPQNYKQDGALNHFGYFGFSFNGADRAERLLTYMVSSGGALSFVSRTENRFVEVDVDNNFELNSRVSWNDAEQSSSRYSDCDPIGSNCYVWRKRLWIPLAQDDNRLYMLEPQYMDWKASFERVEEDQVQLSRWPEVKVNYYESIPYPTDIVIEN